MSSPSNVPATTAASQTANNAAATTASNLASQEIMSGNISSLADLQQQAPDVYLAMMQGIAMNICNQMQQDQADLQQMQEEFRREDEEGN